MKNKSSKSKKIRLRTYLIIGATVCAMVALFLYNNYRLRAISNDIIFDELPASEVAAHFTLSTDCSVTILDDEMASFDMGSRHSLIGRQMLQHIIDSNHPHSIKPAMLYTKDVNGNYKIYTKKLTTDITLPNPECPDSVYWIHNVDFLIDNTIDYNVLGMNVLKHFAIQRLYDTNEVILYFDAPEYNYMNVCGIKLHESLLGSLFSNEINRVSIPLIVNGEDPRHYFMDTGRAMHTIEVVQPEENLASAAGRVERDSVTGVLTQHRCKVKFGNRLRFTRVIYENDIHTDKYGMNPLNFFNQDCILDIPNSRLLIRRPDK